MQLETRDAIISDLRLDCGISVRPLCSCAITEFLIQFSGCKRRLAATELCDTIDRSPGLVLPPDANENTGPQRFDFGLEPRLRLAAIKVGERLCEPSEATLNARVVDAHLRELHARGTRRDRRLVAFERPLVIAAHTVEIAEGLMDRRVIGVTAAARTKKSSAVVNRSSRWVRAVSLAPGTPLAISMCITAALSKVPASASVS